MISACHNVHIFMRIAFHFNLFNGLNVRVPCSPWCWSYIFAWWRNILKTRTGWSRRFQLYYKDCKDWKLWFVCESTHACKFMLSFVTLLEQLVKQVAFISCLPTRADIVVIAWCFMPVFCFLCKLGKVSRLWKLCIIY